VDHAIVAALRADGREHVALVAGGSDFMALVRARDVEDLREVVLERLRRVAWARSTLTTLILDEAAGGHPVT
jgi:DNA-binding Lrp family transcriptional regulator